MRWLTVVEPWDTDMAYSSHPGNSCSFCSSNREEDGIAHLIQGPGVSICDRCIDVARRLTMSVAAPRPAGEGGP